MKLFLNKDIAAESDKMKYWMSGEDAISFTDISYFLDYMRDYYPADNAIEVEIHSCGGDCTEGYAIYDALRASGKEISCKVVGECASMATIILLAAPAERRTMMPHAKMLIHEPYFPSGISGSISIAKLEAIKADLVAEKEKMMAIYTERTGTSAEVLEEQIADGGWFDAEKAIELGFISSIVPMASAQVEEKPVVSTTQEKKEMKVNETSAIGKAFATIAKALGIAEEVEETPKALVVTDVNGVEINIESDNAEPQVGDKVDVADGEYILEDGRTLVVEDGTITEIKEKETEETIEEQEETNALKEENETLKEENETLKAEIETLKSNAKSEDETSILASVAKMGGIDAIKAMATGKGANFHRTNNKGEEVSETALALQKKVEEKKASLRK